jgi:uncharacterized repeat protein (TIGR01451 family)
LRPLFEYRDGVGNGISDLSASDGITVQCPGLANQQSCGRPVNAGQAKGYTIDVTNGLDAGTGTAAAVALTDTLPANTGLDWTITLSLSPD